VEGDAPWTGLAGLREAAALTASRFLYFSFLAARIANSFSPPFFEVGLLGEGGGSEKDRVLDVVAIPLRVLGVSTLFK
jgi:hypothetical protein